MGSGFDYLGAVSVKMPTRNAQLQSEGGQVRPTVQISRPTKASARQPTKAPSRPAKRLPSSVSHHVAAAAKVLAAVPKTATHAAMKKAGANLAASLTPQKKVALKAASKKTDASTKKANEAAAKAAITAGNRAIAAGNKLAKKNPKAGKKLVAAGQKLVAKAKAAPTHVGQIAALVHVDLQHIKDVAAEMSALTAEDNALSQAADLAALLTDAVNRLNAAGQTDVAQAGQALIDRCMAVINNYDPDVGDPTVVGTVAQISADAQAWQAQAQAAGVAVNVSSAGTKVGTPAVSTAISSLQTAGQAAMASGQQLMQVASMSQTPGIPAYSMPAPPTQTGTYPTTAQGYMGMDPMTLAQTAQTVGQQAVTLAQQGRALPANSDATVWMTQATAATQAAQAVSAACQQAYMVASAAATQAAAQSGGGGGGGGDSGGGFSPDDQGQGYDDQGQGYDDQGNEGGDQGDAAEGYYEDGTPVSGGDVMIVSDGDQYDTSDDSSGDQGDNEGGDDLDDDSGLDLVGGGGGHGEGGHGGHGGHGRGRGVRGGWWGGPWWGDYDGFDYLEAVDAADDEVTLDDVVNVAKALKKVEKKKGGKTVIGAFDIQQSQRQMDTLKQVTVGIAKVLVKRGQQVANETILQAKGVSTAADALAVATSGGVTSDLPGITSLKNTLGHLNWHANALAKLSDASAIYSSGDDLKKWTMQAWIDANSVEEGRERQQEIWTEMWVEIGDAVAKLPAKLAKAVAAIPGQLIEAVTGIPVWVWIVGGVTILGLVGFGVYKIIKGNAPTVLRIAERRLSR